MNLIKNTLKVLAIFSLLTSATFAADTVEPGDIVAINGMEFRMISCMDRMHGQPQECRYSGCERGKMVLTIENKKLCPFEFEPIACLCEVDIIDIEIPEGER